MKHDLKQMQLDKQKKLKAKLFTKSLQGQPRYKAVEQIREKESENLCKGSINRFEVFGIKGIYFLFREGKLLYIGESECITTRISQHIMDGVKNFDSYKILPFDGIASERKKLEKKLIKKHAPLLNVVHNKSITL